MPTQNVKWKFKLEAKKHQTGYTITASVIQAPKPGVYSDWDAPHSDWNKAIQHAEEKLEAMNDGNEVYIVDGQEYTDYKEALKNLKQPQ